MSRATHRPCCSSHGENMTCEKYRRTHFVEVRPCCAADAAELADEGVAVSARAHDAAAAAIEAHRSRRYGRVAARDDADPLTEAIRKRIDDWFASTSESYAGSPGEHPWCAGLASYIADGPGAVRALLAAVEEERDTWKGSRNVWRDRAQRAEAQVAAVEAAGWELERLAHQIPPDEMDARTWDAAIEQAWHILRAALATRLTPDAAR